MPSGVPFFLSCHGSFRRSNPGSRWTLDSRVARPSMQFVKQLRLWKRQRGASSCSSPPLDNPAKSANWRSNSSMFWSQILRPSSGAWSKALSRRERSSRRRFLLSICCTFHSPKIESRSPSYLQSWVERMVPGAVLVVTSTNSGSGSEYTATRRYVADQLPSTVISLGPTTEIFVAQIPVEGTTPLIDLLDNAPAAFHRLFALFAERSAYRHVLGPEPASPSDVITFIDSLKEVRQTEREAFKIALDATRETIATLMRESATLKSELLEFRDRANRELAEQKEQARLDMVLMRDEYFGRLDELTARLSTSAARHAREITTKELALEAQRHETEVFAGEAAEAQRRIAELLSTSSWRMTAPVRLLSRLVGTHAKGPSLRQD